MARTASTMLLEFGDRAPEFALPNVDGSTVSLSDFAGKPALVVMFICNHCPFVKHIRDELASFGRDAQAKGVGVIAIMSNEIENYPDDAPDKMRTEAAEAGYTFPYLFDETQDVAKAYKAACTPDFYIFDANQRLAYRGQLDDSRPKTDIPVTGADLRKALDCVLTGAPLAEQKPSIGCNIKWKPGNEPEYYGS